MAEVIDPMFDKNKPPGNTDLSSYISEKSFAYWNHLVNYIAESYPGVFQPEWLFSGSSVINRENVPVYLYLFFKNHWIKLSPSIWPILLPFSKTSPLGDPQVFSIFIMFHLKLLDKFLSYFINML